ncbi:O-antigen ligase family protein [Aurantimicrobium sp.]|uniref:O-antigen ligase family protein n=2 Tax=Aurantimicrobium sp. TaxID=1930784 RepID=UPI002FC99337
MMEKIASVRSLGARLYGSNLSSIFTALGIFTVSWEKFGNVGIAGYNLKLSVILFAFSLLFSWIDSWRRNIPLRPPFPIIFALALVLLYALIGLISTSQVAAQAQTVAVITGALIPFLAVLINVKLYGNFSQLLNAFIYGAIFASIFGLYQLAAFYSGLPQIVSYRATDVNGYGRISSFSYESGYFGYFLVLAMVAVLARSVLTKTPTNQWLLGLFALTLVLANSRAAFVTIPILLGIFIFFWPRRIPRPRFGWLATLGAIGLVVVIAMKPDVMQAVAVRFFSLFDPNEASSNAPRLAVLNSSWQIFSDNPLWGIGPSSLRDFLYSYGFQVSPTASPNSVIANNSFFQALLDGGVILFLAELAFVITAIAFYMHRSHSVAWILMSGWLTVLVVSGFVTSYFWDIKLWVFLALAICAYAVQKSPISNKSRISNSFG